MWNEKDLLLLLLFFKHQRNTGCKIQLKTICSFTLMEINSFSAVLSYIEIKLVGSGEISFSLCIKNTVG